MLQYTGQLQVVEEGNMKAYKMVYMGGFTSRVQESESVFSAAVY